MKSYENIITNLFLLLTPAVLFGETAVMNPRSQGEGRKKTKRSSPKKQKKQPEKKTWWESMLATPPSPQVHHLHTLGWDTSQQHSASLHAHKSRSSTQQRQRWNETKWNCSPWPQHPHSYSRCSSKSALAAERRMGLEPGTWIQTSLLTQRKASLGSQRRAGMLYEPEKFKQAFSTTAATGS